MLGRRPVLIFLMLAGWSIFLTLPLVFHLFTHLPRGDEPAATVPLFNLWTLQWNIDQLKQGYPAYWNAPIFAPLTGAFAFSEIQPLSALLAAPLWFFSPALAYNGLILLFLTLNGWFAYWLLRAWQVALGPALLAALIVPALPFVAQEMGVLQLTALFGPLWLLLFLTRFLHESRRGPARWSTVAGLGLGIPITFLTCGYYGVFSLIFLPLALAWQWVPLRRPAFGQLALAGLLAFTLTAPWLWPQQRILSDYGFTRRAETVAANSARLADYTKFLDHNWFYSRLLGLESGGGQRLFPGAGLVILSGLGLLGAAQRRVKAYLLLVVGLSLLLSVGLRLEVGGWQPYQGLRELVPGLAQLRSPFRFAAMMQLHLALLAGFGLSNLQSWVSPGKVVAAGAAALVVLEALALPLPLQPVPALDSRAAWQAWLNRQPEPAIILRLPFPADGRVPSFEQTVVWMLENRYHQGRLVNGYSGFFPAFQPELRHQLDNFPAAASVRWLTRHGVKVIIMPGQPPPSPYFEPLFFDDSANVTILKLIPGRH